MTRDANTDLRTKDSTRTTGASTALLAAFVAAQAVAVAGCALEAGDGADPAGDVTVQSAYTSTDPLVDAELWAYVQPHGLTKATFTDMSSNGSTIFLDRSDGTIENRTQSSTLPFVSSHVANPKVDHIRWVPSGKWGLVASSDTTHQIFQNAQLANAMTALGSYPTGVNYVEAIAAAPVAGGLKIFIVRPDPPGPGALLQVGTYLTAAGYINWETATHPWGMYNNGMTYLAGSLYTAVAYTGSFFSWYSTTTFASSWETHLPPHTEHAYHDPAGFDDRFAPIGFDYDAADGYFYGLDDEYSTVTMTHRWVLGRLLKSNLKP